MIIDKFGTSTEELKVIQETLDRISAAGHDILSVTVKMLPAQGVAGKNGILVSPNSNLSELSWAVAHEIGHHNEPENWTTFNLWTGENCSDANWQENAAKISEYATVSPQEFWAERFAEKFS